MKQKNILRGRMLTVLPAILIQIVWLYMIFSWFSPYAALIQSILSIMAFILVLYIVSNRDDGAYKVFWLIIILSMPVLGALLYILFGNKKTARRLERRLKNVRQDIEEYLLYDEAVEKELENTNKRVYQTFSYVSALSGFPILRNEFAQYYSIGEELFSCMLEEMEKAEEFIFVEYFIIEDGKLWQAMVDIMKRKAAKGVDVRVLYDDLGSISTFSGHNAKELIDSGIKIVAFNPLKFISGVLNNRDHRKILVIDNKVAFSGGLNLADEYINEIEKFGHWKDIGFKITGPAVLSYTFMFNEFWNAFSGTPFKLPVTEVAAMQKFDGYILPYYDSPSNDTPISYNLYIELLEMSKDYIWFYTPYLILGEQLIDALIRTAKRGVDVRIIMPGIPDKKTVYEMSRSYYRPLMEAGVRIFEYTKGFIHAKACVSDDEIGTIGTVNLDYRSLFLHYECNSLFYNAQILKDIKEDMKNICDISKERNIDDRGFSLIKITIDSIKRIFAPLC